MFEYEFLLFLHKTQKIYRKNIDLLRNLGYNVKCTILAWLDFNNKFDFERWVFWMCVREISWKWKRSILAVVMKCMLYVPVWISGCGVW